MVLVQKEIKRATIRKKEEQITTIYGPSGETTGTTSVYSDVAPSDGLYRISADVKAYMSGYYGCIDIIVNGATVKTFKTDSTSYVSFSYDIQLETLDIVELYLYGTQNQYAGCRNVQLDIVDINRIENQIRPDTGWKPGANTIARWKLDGDTSDSTSNGYDLTVKTGSISYGTLSGGTKYGIFNGSTILTKTSVPSWTKGTVSFWTNKLSTSELVTFAQSTNTNGSDYYAQVGLKSNTISIWTAAALQHHDFSYTQNTNQWYHIVLTQDGTSMKLYVNSTLIDTWTNSIWFNVNNGNQLCVGGLNRGTQNYTVYNGYLSNMIIESEARTVQEITDYYNQTKSLYGIS